jgi:hypothetical protein
VARLKVKRFLRRENIDFHEQPETAVFCLFGFPWDAGDAYLSR